MRLVVHLRRDEADSRRGQLLFAVAAEDTEGQAFREITRPLDWDRHVQFESLILVDGREHRLRRDLVPHAHRHVADGPGRWRGERVVTELHFLLLQLRLQRLQLRLGRPQAGFRLFELLFADRSRGEQFAGALLLLSRERDVGFPCRALRFLTEDRGLLAAWIDLHQRRSLWDAVARLHEDLCDLPVDLRLDGRGAQRLEGADIFSGVVDGRCTRRRDRHGGRRHRRRRGGRLTPVARKSGERSHGQDRTRARNVEHVFLYYR